MSTNRTVGPVTGATAGAAALTTIIFWALASFGIDAPGEVQGAFTVLLVLLAGFLVPSSREPGAHEATEPREPIPGTTLDLGATEYRGE